MIIAIWLLAASLWGYTDSFAQMQSDPLFLSMLDAVKNGRSEAEAESAYDAYVAAEDDPVCLSRAEYHMVRYHQDMGNDFMARAHLEEEMRYLGLIGEEASEVEVLAAEVDATSSEYYVDHKLGVGMENSRLVKEMYRRFPDEFYAAIQEGFRLLYTPPIAGGSARKALRIFESVESDMEGISRLDRYSLLVGKAMALSELGRYDESDAYLDKAEEIYTFDPAAAETRAENARNR